jgi:hypothetical protein
MISTMMDHTHGSAGDRSRKRRDLSEDGAARQKKYQDDPKPENSGRRRHETIERHAEVQVILV